MTKDDIELIVKREGLFQYNIFDDHLQMGNEVILKNDSFRVPNKGKSRGSCGCRDCYKRYRDCIDRVLGLNLKVLSEAVQ